MSAALLALLQLSDSGFPSGSFTHSYGIEQALNQRLIAGADDVECFVRSVVLQSGATADARACYAAGAAARDGDLAALVEADRALLRTKAAAELREACLQTGRRLLEETVIHLGTLSDCSEPPHPASSNLGASSNLAPSPSTERGKLATRAGGEARTPLLPAYAAAVDKGEAPGCHPVAFGAVGAALEVEPADAASALLMTTANALLQAAMRLGRISHRDAQAVLHRLRPLMAEISRSLDPAVQSCETVGPLTLTLSLQGEGTDEALRAFHPLQEIASMRHKLAEARLFAS